MTFAPDILWKYTFTYYLSSLSRRHAYEKRDFMLFTSGFILPSSQRDVEILLKVGSNFSEVQAYPGDMASLVQDHCNKANIANSSYMIFLSSQYI